MNTFLLRLKLIPISFIFFLSGSFVHAGIPLWTMVPLTATHISVPANASAIIQYQVTNQSKITKRLLMTPIAGVTQVTPQANSCRSPMRLRYKESCILALRVDGNTLKGTIIGGPVLCQEGNALQCYQPSAGNRLGIAVSENRQQYLITPLAGANGTISPNTPQTVDAGGTLVFTATPAAGFGVHQWLLDGVVVQTGGNVYSLANINANHQVEVNFSQTTLTASVSALTLAVNCPPASSCTTTHAQLTGNPRQITIVNSGSSPALGLTISDLGLPPGTNFTTTCGTILNAGDSCIITVQPGPTASANIASIPCTSGTIPTPGTITVSAANAGSVQAEITVLGFGCIYQGGFIFSIDDSYLNHPITDGIGGKTAATSDTFLAPTAPGVGTPNWGGNGTDIGAALYDTDPQGANEGAPNTAAIVATLTPPAALSTYAAGLCSTLSVDANGTAGCVAPATCYGDWYLPAVCELAAFGGICTGTNIQEQLYEATPSLGGIVVNGYYWSSTEFSGFPANAAQTIRFIPGGVTLAALGKNTRIGVRCARTF